MPTHFAFRLSTYLTLGLACACLSYAEWDLLRQASFFGGLVIVFLVIAFLCDGRYELDLTSANRLGFGIGLAGTAWLAYQFLNKNSLIYTFPWPASLLPYLGPLLMVLMPAKLFRPKHIGDWWAMQGIGLATASLAAAMEDDAIFGVLLALYAVCGVWSLSLFFYLRVAGLLPPVPLSDPGPPVTILASTIRVEETQFGREFLGRALGWVALAIAIAAPFFVLTPRSAAPKWTFGQQRLETGLTQENFSDLNRTGELKPSREAAFELTINRRDGTPVTDFNLEQRFRSSTFNSYEGGRWVRVDTQPILMNTARLIRDDRSGGALPNFGPNQIDITFVPKIRLTEPILADPVNWETGKASPIVTLSELELRPWLHGKDGLFRPFGIPMTKGGVLPYRQSFVSPAETDLGPPWEPMSAYQPLGSAGDPDSLWYVFRNHRLTKLRAWSRELAVRLGKSNPAVQTALDRAIESPTFQLIPQDFEVVARAVTAYFAQSPEYEYTLKLRRLDAAADPIEEFLYRSKQGHCERFAAGTALVLRSLGIPAAYVLGYRGCEPDADTAGLYLVRQELAHAWVEIAIPRPAPAGFEFRRRPNDRLDGKPVVWHWLSLDPTPAEGTEDSTDGAGDVLKNPWAQFVNFFSDFIIGYDPEKRRGAFEAVSRWFLGPFGQGLIWLSIAGLVALVLARRHRRRRLAAMAPSGIVWFDRYRSILQKYGRPPQAGETLAEQATRLSVELGSDAPKRIVALYYEARFAGRTIATAELDAVEAALTELTILIRQTGPE